MTLEDEIIEQDVRRDKYQQMKKAQVDAGLASESSNRGGEEGSHAIQHQSERLTLNANVTAISAKIKAQSLHDAHLAASEPSLIIHHPRDSEDPRTVVK